jgi:hypothetical protein
MVRHAITLGARPFSSKEDAKKHIQSILDRNRNNEALTGEDKEVILALLERHPKYEQKFGKGISEIFVKGLEKSRCFWLKYKDGSAPQDFSYKNCLYDDIDFVYKLRQKAYRTAVQAQIEAYKSQHQHDRCAECNCVSHEIHVDHEKPQFLELTRQFEKKQSDPPTEFAQGLYISQKVFKPEDAKFEQSWQEYHQLHASLRILCAKCNLTREKSKQK